ncbi:hypothetical protein M409DRAFT_58912 [Zasmidium cellare ATCC 36951]|uniref:Homeobox domain-containing protein n=1 Tax=Zasmidium cellare ATCC 36951 TaxID=1080233 RepID=A0A6A6C3X3_ZASCE|nr:uncharacterized protein M409DRAFT_58912 [Zasmidium cellare ATCC 36951]KAF2161847.1 hypothetical protein M409DRAFT_58912 [Zasmidium cellare ATCC 36951]
MAFVAPSAGHMPFHDAGETYVDAHHHQHHHPYASHASMPEHFPQHVPHHMSCDIKPRLTKEQHDILEAHYQKQQKPNTNTKKGFADSLGVSLDKVNNWFQNRRAKSKQDAKKQAGAFNLFAQQQQPASANYPSDSDTSPSFTSADYFSMMQQCAADDNTSTSMSMSSMPQFQDQVHGLPYANNTTPHEDFNIAAMGQGQQLQGDMFDSPQEMNRRTLTQEQFDAFAQNGGMMRSGQFDTLHNGFSGDADVLRQVFPEMQNEFKQQDTFAFPAPIGAPLSSNDSSVPSTISEQSIFPSSTTMQEQYSVSAPASDWGDSRSSSVSLSQEHQYQQVPASQQAPNASTSQWQPGQSVPVDPNDLQQQFREAAQRQQQLHQQQQMVQHEQPLAWPADEAFVRRDSQNGTMLAQQMSNFAIQTPQPQQTATFKTPAHPGEQSASIAVRRQRPKPQPLGMAALRSQSYSGAVQPASPGQQQTSNLAAPGQQLRRIRSSNVINGVAQGRVMKSVPGSAQRSPLNWTFADAATNSPKMLRHASSSSMGNLAPPTPMSPKEAAARQEQSRPQFPPWQSASGHFSRQASISETDAEHNVPMPSQSVPPQPVSSPPHTPLYHHHHQQHSQQQLSQARVGNNVITENTPPQSAPAAQTSFPANVFVAPQQQQQQQQPQQMQAYMLQQHYMNAPVPEQHFQVPASYGPAQQFVIPVPDGSSQMSMQFASGGVPVVNAQGNLTMAYPPQMQQMQFIQHAPPQTQGQQQQPHMQTPPQGGQQFSFVTSSGASPGMNVTTQLPKPPQPASEFFVHEYSPPQDIKRTATPRKPPVDHGPKSYTFANQGPEHFEKEKAKKGDKSGTASNSPASATSSS